MFETHFKVKFQKKTQSNMKIHFNSNVSSSLCFTRNKASDFCEANELFLLNYTLIFLP